jgi:hypothetical protein
MGPVKNATVGEFQNSNEPRRGWLGQILEQRVAALFADHTPNNTNSREVRLENQFANQEEQTPDTNSEFNAEDVTEQAAQPTQAQPTQAQPRQAQPTQEQETPDVNSELNPELNRQQGQEDRTYRPSRPRRLQF